MEYYKFCYYNNHVTSLTKQEIKNPLLVLEDIFKRRDLEDFKKNLWEYFLIIFRDQLWRINGAPYHYSIYRDLIRLIDAIRLINACHPELSTIHNNSHQFSSKSINSFDQVFIGIQEKHRNTSQTDSYFSSSLSSIKQNIFNYLQIGLNASHMSNDKYYYFAIEENHVIADFMGLESLIEEGQNIYMESETIVQNSRYKKHLKFASDCDHITLLDLEAISDPIDLITLAFDRIFIFEQLAESLKMWEKSFYQINFWLNANSPGNMIFFAESIKEIIECIWLLVQQDQIDINIEIEKLTNKEKKLYPTLNEDELTQPYITIKSFFEHKKMHEWKTELDVWTNISLSETDIILAEDIDKTSINLCHLLKFLEATHLITYYSPLKDISYQ